MAPSSSAYPSLAFVSPLSPIQTSSDIILSLDTSKRHSSSTKVKTKTSPAQTQQNSSSSTPNGKNNNTSPAQEAYLSDLYLSQDTHATYPMDLYLSSGDANPAYEYTTIDESVAAHTVAMTEYLASFDVAMNNAAE